MSASKQDQTAVPATAPLARRTWLVGAGATGALAAAATLLPSKPAAVPTVAAAAPSAAEADGYQVTDHVKRYYATTRL